MELFIVILFMLFLGIGLFLYLKVMQEPTETENKKISIPSFIYENIGVLNFFRDIKKIIFSLTTKIRNLIIPKQYTREQQKEDRDKLINQFHKINATRSLSKSKSQRVLNKFDKKNKDVKQKLENSLDGWVDRKSVRGRKDISYIYNEDTFWDDDPTIAKQGFEIMKARGRKITRPLELRYNPEVGFSQWGFSVKSYR